VEKIDRLLTDAIINLEEKKRHSSDYNLKLLIQLTKEGADEIVMHYASVSINEREQPS